MNKTFIFTIISLMIGWFLKEASEQLRGRSTTKKALSKAIVSLLELHSALLREKILLQEFKKIYPNNLVMDNMALLAIREVLAESNYNFEDFTERYNNAVNIISETDPLLGFKLRTAGEIPNAILDIKGNNDDHDAPNPLTNFLQNYYLETTIPDLENLILKISSRYSFLTRFEIKRRFNSKEQKYSKKIQEILKDFDPIYNAIHKKVEQLQDYENYSKDKATETSHTKET